MTHVKIKGFKIFNDRHGRKRCYHRATGAPIDLEKHPIGSPEFLAACAAIVQPPKARPGTLERLIDEWRKSPAYINLRPNTKSFYDYALAYLEPITDTPLKDFDSALVLKIRDKVDLTRGWYFANQVKTTISVIFSWGKDRDIGVKSNPAAGIKKIKRPKDLARANRPWKDTERFAVLDASEYHIMLPIALMMYLGMDPIDAITVRKEQYDGTAMAFSRTKTGEEVWRPVPSALKLILDAAPAHDAHTLAANSYGQSWTRSGFNSSWLKVRGELETQKKVEPGLTLKGLRHSHATMLGEMGEDDRTIADALAQKTEGMARWYSRDANRRKKLEAVTVKYDAEEVSRREKVSNLSEKVSNHPAEEATKDQ